MDTLVYLASLTARSFCLAAAVLAGAWLFRVKTAAVRHALMTIVTAGMLLLGALAPALPPLPLRLLPAQRTAAAFPAAIYALEQPTPVEPPAAATWKTPSSPPRWWLHIEWPLAAAVLYYAGTAILLLRLVYGYLFTRRLVAASRREGDIYASAWISVPVTVGWLRPKILLPAEWKGWAPDKLEAVLAHERTHIERGDWVIGTLAAVNRCVFWFNPLAWWLERKMAFLAEQACDDGAVLATGARESYAEALLDMAAAVRTGRGRVLWEAMAMAKTAEVRRRIGRILDESRQIPRGLTRTRWAALLACSVPVIYLATVVHPARSAAPAMQADVAQPAQQAQAMDERIRNEVEKELKSNAGEIEKTAEQAQSQVYTFSAEFWAKELRFMARYLASKRAQAQTQEERNKFDEIAREVEQQIRTLEQEKTQPVEKIRVMERESRAKMLELLGALAPASLPATPTPKAAPATSPAPEPLNPAPPPPEPGK